MQPHPKLAARCGTDGQHAHAVQLSADHHFRHHRKAQPFAHHADDRLVVDITRADARLDAILLKDGPRIEVEPAVWHQKLLVRELPDREHIPLERILQRYDGAHRVVPERRPVASEAGLPCGEDDVRLPFFQQLKRLQLVVDHPQIDVDVRADAAEPI